MELKEVRLAVPEGFQMILGQSHFIKSVEDIYEALATSSPSIKFGVAFCEASGKSLIRYDGSDEAATKVAREFAAKVGAGHSFVVILKDAFPINVLDRLKAVDEVVGLFCATSNPVSVVVADSGDGRGVLGVIDGTVPRGEESDEDRAERKDFLRKIGYKR
jgi:uncharacterized protein